MAGVGRGASCVALVALVVAGLAASAVASEEWGAAKLPFEVFQEVATASRDNPAMCDGELGDCQCDVKAVELANSKQLHIILEELSQSTFFRLFKVNLENKCKFWKKPKAEGEEEEEEDEEYECTGGADAHESEPEGEPLCSLDTGGGDSASPFPFGGVPLGGASTKEAGAPSFMPLGGAEYEANADEDEGAETAEKESRHTHTAFLDGWMPMHSRVDGTITRLEGDALRHQGMLGKVSDCESPDYFMDMCSAIPTNSSNYVNLALNPEKWTGYNGSHVWQSIYQENALSWAGDKDLLEVKRQLYKYEQSTDRMCYEERILYRLLSGMHASINTHIALSAKRPKRGSGSKKYLPDPSMFMKHFGDHPERLKNLHFAFVVILRAVKRASPILYHYNYTTGDTLEDKRTALLVRHLLDSAILEDCQQVFTAFDESLLFAEDPADTAAPPRVQLKQQFKQVFHNISAVLDCVGCQKCRLHGKLQLLGIGTALKVLLLPKEMLGAPLSKSSLTLERQEIVALVQALAKFSSAIEAVSALSTAYWEEFQGGYKATPVIDVPPAVVVVPDEPVLKSAAQIVANTSLAVEKAAQAAIAAAAAAAAAMQALGAQSGGDLVRRSNTAAVGNMELVEAALAAVADLAEANRLTESDEDMLVSAALEADTNTMLLSKYFATRRPAAFARHALRSFSSGAPVVKVGDMLGSGHGSLGRRDFKQPAGTVGAVDAAPTGKAIPDAIVIGGGLAGVTTALTLLDRGATVVLMERMKFLGGNSAKASSGINGIDDHSPAMGDSSQVYLEDMLKGGNMTLEDYPLAGVLVQRSGKALEWIRRRSGLPLEKRGQLGGHSRARTHRPSSGMSGAEMIFALESALKPLIKEGEAAKAAGKHPRFALMKGTTVTRLLTTPGGDVNGVGYMTTVGKGKSAKQVEGELRAHNVVLATGGYAADRSETSVLAKFRPDLLELGSTNGVWADGSGHRAAFAIGAAEMEMNNVQVHPTGFIDPKRPEHPTKTLCAELLRGVGGILLDRDGKRFVNELGTRDHVTAQMQAAARRTGGPIEITIMLNAAAAAIVDKHVPLYTKKGLLEELPTLQAVADWMHTKGRLRDLGVDDLSAELRRYDAGIVAGTDAFGKDSSQQLKVNAPVGTDAAGPFYVGTVTPVLHYCMGGLHVDNDASVLRPDGTVIRGLHAAGEVVGGIHGHNRLGGNALTECVVFGQLVGEKIQLQAATKAPTPTLTVAAAAAATTGAGSAAPPAVATGPRTITAEELAAHNTEESTWVLIKGKVYDFTDFLEEHPAGPQAIVDIAGKDGTEEFEHVHTLAMLDDFDTIGVAA